MGYTVQLFKIISSKAIFKKVYSVCANNLIVQHIYTEIPHGQNSLL